MSPLIFHSSICTSSARDEIAGDWEFGSDDDGVPRSEVRRAEPMGRVGGGLVWGSVGG